VTVDSLPDPPGNPAGGLVSLHGTLQSAELQLQNFAVLAAHGSPVQNPYVCPYVIISYYSLYITVKYTEDRYSMDLLFTV
jgi:hypothetical protein